MRVITIVAVLALAGAVPAAAQTCGLVKVASYEMQPTGTGHVAIKMRIGDAEELMAVDTGAWFSFLDAKTVDAMKLPTRSMSDQFVSYDAYGRRTSEVATAPSIAIGPLTVEAVDFVVATRETVFGGGESGLLGANVLKHFDLDFDFASKTLNFFSQDHCPGQVVYWTHGASRIPFAFDGSAITLPVTLDGKDLYAELDSGAPISTISAPMANQIFNLAPGGPGVDKHEGRGGDGTSWTEYTHTFTSLGFGGVSVPYATLHILPDRMGAAVRQDNARQDYTRLMPHTPQILLGISELHHLHVYISYKEKLLYVTAADAH